MTNRSVALLGAILVTTIASASAADTALMDLRLVGSYAVITDESFRGGTVDKTVDRARCWSVALQHVRSLGPAGGFGGLFYGGELFYARGKGNFDSFGTELALETTSWGLSGLLGWAYALGAQPALHTELGPYGCIGKTDTVLYTSSTSPVALKGSDAMSEVGVRGAAYWTFTERHQVGIEARYAFFNRTAPSVESGGSSARFVIERSGLSIGVGAGYRY